MLVSDFVTVARWGIFRRTSWIQELSNTVAHNPLVVRVSFLIKRVPHRHSQVTMTAHRLRRRLPLLNEYFRRRLQVYRILGAGVDKGSLRCILAGYYVIGVETGRWLRVPLQFHRWINSAPFCPGCWIVRVGVGVVLLEEVFFLVNVYGIRDFSRLLFHRGHNFVSSFGENRFNNFCTFHGCELWHNFWSIFRLCCYGIEVIACRFLLVNKSWRMDYVNLWFGTPIEVLLCFYSVVRCFDLHRVARIVCELLDIHIYRAAVFFHLFTALGRAERFRWVCFGDGNLSLRKTRIQFFICRSERCSLLDQECRF